MELKEAIEARRAYRSLDPVRIDEAMVKGIVEDVRLAPSCFNNQPWRFVFVYSRTPQRAEESAEREEPMGSVGFNDSCRGQQKRL